MKRAILNQDNCIAESEYQKGQDIFSGTASLPSIIIDDKGFPLTELSLKESTCRRMICENRICPWIKRRIDTYASSSEKAESIFQVQVDCGLIVGVFAFAPESGRNLFWLTGPYRTKSSGEEIVCPSADASSGIYFPPKL